MKRTNRTHYMESSRAYSLTCFSSVFIFLSFFLFFTFILFIGFIYIYTYNNHISNNTKRNEKKKNKIWYFFTFLKMVRTYSLTHTYTSTNTQSRKACAHRAMHNYNGKRNECDYTTFEWRRANEVARDLLWQTSSLLEFVHEANRSTRIKEHKEKKRKRENQIGFNMYNFYAYFFFVVIHFVERNRWLYDVYAIRSTNYEWQPTLT